METPPDFGAAMDRVEEQLERAGEQVVNRGEIEPTVGEPQQGFAVAHGSHRLLVLGDPEQWFFRVLYQNTVVEKLAQQAAIAEVIEEQEPPESGEVEVEVEVTDQHVEQALQKAVQILASQDEDKKEKLRRRFIQKLSTPSEGVAYQLIEAQNVTDSDVTGVLGFNTETRLWPYEDSFSASDVHKACQTVISNGLPIATLLQKQFGLGGTIEDLVGSAGHTTPDQRETRGFQ